jgi:hypothetical protein
MSLLSSFLISHFIPALESAFVAHEPELQAALLQEVEAFGGQLGVWIASKMDESAPKE